MKSIRILLTEKCNANCKNCFNAEYRRNKDMKLEDFKQLCDYLNKNNIKKLKVMGGEPTYHPDFLEMMEYAQEKFKGIHIFTNAINNEIIKIRLRNTDSIVYNSYFLDDEFSIEKLMLDNGGSRTFETQISSDSDIKGIKKNFYRIINEARIEYGEQVVKDKIGINLTLNCVENIFAKKHIIIIKWNELYDYIKEILKVDVKVDHSVPWCFFVNTDMKIKQGIWKCNYQCSGLIDTDLILRYCNQMPKKLLQLKQNGRFVPFKIVENHLYMANLQKISNNLQKICKSCMFFGNKCNGGCFMHKEIITKASILKNTDLPKK